jgi:methylenetetrahydrofolate reductase (NADPH)
MKISDIFEQKEKTFSFEFFPPKDEISAVDFGINVGRLMKLSPSFVSVTYGAGGGSQERTFALTDYLRNRIGLTCMAHYTCVDASRDKIISDMEYLKSINIENLMLLRGDPPKGSASFEPHAQGFAYASELIEAVVAQFGNQFSIGAGCYPEGHPEAKSCNDDVKHLKNKVDAGADFLITQLFFDNARYFDFVRSAREAGIRCRIIPGIIPLTSYAQIQRFTKMSATTIPAELAEKMESSRDNPRRLYQTGVDHAISQCRELLAGGAPGIHFYTLNKSRAAVEIFEQLVG